MWYNINHDGIPDDDPAYEVLLEKYLGAVERHLRERGWLDKALAYRFDEPPVGSIRGEMMRDGIEDYEYFAMLERLLDGNAAKIPGDMAREFRRLLSVPAEVSRSPSDFSVDPANIERHRLRLARAIMKASEQVRSHRHD